jgi:hypothetical protein
LLPGSPVSGEDPAGTFIVSQLVLLNLFLGSQAEAGPGHELETGKPDEVASGLADAICSIADLGDGHIDFLEFLTAGFSQPQGDVSSLGTVGLVGLISAGGRSIIMGTKMFGFDGINGPRKLISTLEKRGADNSQVRLVDSFGERGMYFLRRRRWSLDFTGFFSRRSFFRRRLFLSRGLLLSRSFFLSRGLLFSRSFFLSRGLLFSRSFFLSRGLFLSRSFFLGRGLLFGRLLAGAISFVPGELLFN